MGRRSTDMSLMFPLMNAGKSRSEMAEIIGCSYATVIKFLKTNQIFYAPNKTVSPEFVSPKTAKTEAKRILIEKVLSMHAQGLSMMAIGVHFGFTREYARQLLKTQGKTAKDGANREFTRKKIEAKAIAQEARCQAKYGITLYRYRMAVAEGHTLAFRKQKNSARSRDIPWGLSLGSWLQIWESSGKLAMRGRGKGNYVMCRIKDDGGYAVGNVHIQLSTENGAEAIKNKGGHKAIYTGVFNLYPGLDRPWVAKFGKIQIASCATAEEARDARAKYLGGIGKAGEFSPFKLGHGKGYTPVRGGFQMQGAGKNRWFKKEDDARAAYVAVCAEEIARRKTLANKPQPKGEK